MKYVNTETTDIDSDSEPEQIVLDEPPPVTVVGLAHWFATHTTTPKHGVPGNNQADAPNAGAQAQGPRRTRGAIAGIAVVALAAAVLVAVGGNASHSASSGHPNTAVSVASAASRPASAPTPLVSGNSPGCTQVDSLVAAVTRPGELHAVSGAQVIAQFEAAYYLARNGGRAREVVAASAAVAGAAQIQAGIDSIPAGTTYCAHISPLTTGLYAVEIHEYRPGEPENLWRQQISTSQSNEHTLITAITPL
ncbi:MULTISPECIES: hypothetical protein [unclassified Nocardia]|uniref:hypothetical protein n=1 Tax=unclassified Nocardia TaxID=2637762 RepID=UPI001CE426D9|nr:MULTISPECIES: hypothetical protein [unclassified Nocardia]